MNFGCWGTGLGHDKAIRRSADRVQNQAVLRAGTVNHRRSLFLQQKNRASITGYSAWSEWRDSNSRPLEPHSSTLPSCATPRLKTYLQAKNIIPQRQDLSRVYFYGSTVMEERIMPIQQEYGNVPISAGVNSMMLSPGARPF